MVEDVGDIFGYHHCSKNEFEQQCFSLTAHSHSEKKKSNIYQSYRTLMTLKMQFCISVKISAD